jgi:hypothetical protein
MAEAGGFAPPEIASHGFLQRIACGLGEGADGDGIPFGEWESPLACHALRSDR